MVAFVKERAVEENVRVTEQGTDKIDGVVSVFFLIHQLSSSNDHWISVHAKEIIVVLNLSLAEANNDFDEGKINAV